MVGESAAEGCVAPRALGEGCEVLWSAFALWEYIYSKNGSLADKYHEPFFRHAPVARE